MLVQPRNLPDGMVRYRNPNKMNRTLHTVMQASRVGRIRFDYTWD
jgi:hypothetical protein